MNNLNIPLYRAEVKDSKINREDIEIFTELIDGKRYVIGLLCTKGRQIEVTKGDITTFINIDNLTLAINFYDMQDSQGNKIFASLREDGKGGDSILIEAFREELQKGYCIYKNGRFYAVDEETDTFDILETELEIKVIGIQI